MNRSRVPFWAIDVVALALIGGGWFTNRLATETFLVLLLAILGFGLPGRVPQMSASVTTTASDDSSGPSEGGTVTTTRVGPARASLPSLGGIAGLVAGFAHYAGLVRPG